MRKIVLFVVGATLAACSPEYNIDEIGLPPAPEATLTLGDGTLDPAALEPLGAEVGSFELRGTRPPVRVGDRVRFDLEVNIRTPGGRLGEGSRSAVVVFVDPASPDDPEITVRLEGGDWPAGSEAKIADALRRAWISDFLLDPPQAPDASPESRPVTKGTPKGHPEPVDVRAPPPPRDRPSDPETRPHRRDPISTRATDLLFVVDDSISMERVVERVRGAFRAMDEVGAFPRDTRIAVMSTLPGDPKDLSRIHPAVGDRKFASYEPGFLRLVDRAGIQRWQENADAFAWRSGGCDGWFTPEQVDAQGTACLVANTQLSRLSVGVEAGLTAFSQFLYKNAEKDVFREGSAAHVVFVSDTHDPGISIPKPNPKKPPKNEKAARRQEKQIAAIQSLYDDRPTGEQIAAQVAAQEHVASFRIHAIAPTMTPPKRAKKGERCTGEKWKDIGPSYALAAEATGGRALDLCSETGTAAFLFEALAADAGILSR